MRVQCWRTLREEAAMLHTVWAVVREGRIEVLEPVELVEGGRVLVTVLPDEEAGFWMDASRSAVDAVWGNVEDDVYARLLEA